MEAKCFLFDKFIEMVISMAIINNWKTTQIFFKYPKIVILTLEIHLKITIKLRLLLFALFVVHFHVVLLT